jgi:hypothetical protein
LYGEDGQFHKLTASLFVAREPVHFQGVHGTAALEIFIPDTNQTVGVACGLEDPPGSLELAAIEKLISLAVEPDFFIPGKAADRCVRGLDEGFSGELFESFFIHTLAVI